MRAKLQCSSTNSNMVIECTTAAYLENKTTGELCRGRDVWDEMCGGSDTWDKKGTGCIVLLGKDNCSYILDCTKEYALGIMSNISGKGTASLGGSWTRVKGDKIFAM